MFSDRWWCTRAYAGAGLRGGADHGGDGGEPDAAAAVRERAGALLRHGAGGVRRAVAGHRVHHLLQPHVRCVATDNRAVSSSRQPQLGPFSHVSVTSPTLSFYGLK
jgi:hypothetical protein